MTRAQEVIRNYIYQNYQPDSVLLFPTDKDKIKLIDAEGGKRTLTINIFCDILDVNTKKILAISDLPHDMDKVDKKLPHRWTEVEK